MNKVKPKFGRLLFLDRDGTLIVEKGYPKDPRAVHLLPGVATALRQLKNAGFRLIVVTNQSGVGRGIIRWKEMFSVNRQFRAVARRHKAPVDALYWCPHRPDARCACRKPKLGLVRRAAKKFKLSWRNSISVGDRWSDVQLGQATGGLGVLVRSGYGAKFKNNSHGVTPDFKAKSLREAAQWILQKTKGTNYVR